jgi:hypothetical protein
MGVVSVFNGVGAVWVVYTGGGQTVELVIGVAFIYR